MSPETCFHHRLEALKSALGDAGLQHPVNWSRGYLVVYVPDGQESMVGAVTTWGELRQVMDEIKAKEKQKVS